MVGARPSDSSSISSSFGSGMSAWLTASICCSPPERLPASWSMRSASRGNSVEHALLGLGDRRRVLALEPARQAQVVAHGQRGNTLVPPGIITTPRAAISSVGRPVMSSPSKVTLPRRGRQQPGDALEQRRLAGAVGAEQGDDLALVDVEVEPEEDLHGPVARRRGRGPRGTAASVGSTSLTAALPRSTLVSSSA